MALNTVDYNSYFNYKLSQKQISFTDKTDFVSQGTVAANVKVLAKVTAPVSGVFYNNTNIALPDIDCGTSLDSIIDILLPLDGATSLPEQGEYIIELTYVDSVVPATIVDTRTFTLDYTSPIVDLTMTVDCITPLLKSVDNTGYTRNLVDPTVTRVMAINYPLSMSKAAVTGTANSLSTNIIYIVTGQSVEYSSRLTSDLSYLFDIANSMYVIDEISGAEFIPVSCDGDLCNIYCAIRSQYQRWQDAKKVNTIKANLELAKFEQITSIAGMVGTALKCGKGIHISEYVAEILKIADADGGCACDDGAPQLMTGLGALGVAGAAGEDGEDGINSYVIVDEGVGVKVTASVSGNTTSYEVALSTENITKLANTTNSIVSAGPGASVSTNSSVVGGIQTFTYTVSATDTIVESSFVRVRIKMSPSSVPSIEILNQKQYGSFLTPVEQNSLGNNFITNVNESEFSLWLKSFTDFEVGNFSKNLESFYPEVHFARMVGNEKYNAGKLTETINNLSVDLMEVSQESFRFRFSSPEGAPVSGEFVQTYFDEIELIFKIQA